MNLYAERNKYFTFKLTAGSSEKMWSGTLETQNLLQCASSTAILIVWVYMGRGFALSWLHKQLHDFVKKQKRSGCSFTQPSWAAMDRYQKGAVQLYQKEVQGRNK